MYLWIGKIATMERYLFSLKFNIQESENPNSKSTSPPDMDVEWWANS